MRYGDCRGFSCAAEHVSDLDYSVSNFKNRFTQLFMGIRRSNSRSFSVLSFSLNLYLRIMPLYIVLKSEDGFNKQHAERRSRKRQTAKE